MSDTKELPPDLMSKLLDLAEQLPKDRRAIFLKNVVVGIAQLANDRPRPLVYGVVGWVIGQVLESVLVIPLPMTDEVLEILGDGTSEWMGGAGILTGVGIEIKQEMAALLKRELRAAHGVH
jgi:hypothetical protein